MAQMMECITWLIAIFFFNDVSVQSFSNVMQTASILRQTLHSKRNGVTYDRNGSGLVDHFAVKGD